MEIRDAVPSRDAAACAAIYAPYVTATVISLEEVAPTEQEIAARIAKYEGTHAWLVADDDGETVGFAYGSPHRERASYRWAADVSVYVAPSAQRRGAGKALYTALLHRLNQRGVYQACAGITLPNDASVALHEALGFVPVGIYRNIGFKLGAWRDVGWWQLELRRPDRAPAELGPATP
jgi:phosphinothricin acetyltransferase